VSSRLRKLAPFLGLAVFVLALWVLHRQFAHLHLRDVLGQIEAMPVASITAAVGLTLLSYIVLTGYDALSLYYMSHPLGYGRSALASFLGYAISQNVGMTLVSGAPIRFRLYSAWGLSAVEVATVVAFNGLTFWLGLLTIAGIAFTIGGGSVPTALHVPLTSLRPLGILFLVLVLAYLASCLWIRKPIRIARWELEPPPFRVALLQLAVSSTDWTVSASVLWVLLPREAGVGFPHFLAAFLLAQILGLMSQIPGGFGVFETVVIALLPVGVDASAVLGPLVAYRVIYYLFPLVVAAGVLLAYELVQRRQQVTTASRAIGTGLSLVAPHLLALTTFLGGAVLLVSGATPAVTGRLRWLGDMLPLPALELSHFLASVAGVLLLLLAWGLRRRLESAYYLTLAVLGSGVAFSILKGADYEEALVLAAMMAVLAPTRRFLYRKTPLLSEPLSTNWLAAVAMVLVGACWIGLFAYRHVDYSAELWWQFTLDGDASRFLRGGIGVAMLLLAFGIARLFGPARPRQREASADDLDRVRTIVSASPHASANLALLGDKRFLFSASGRAMIMYAVSGRSWVAMGEPIGPEEEHVELVWSFHALCDRHGGWTVFYEVGEGNLNLFLELGLTVLRIGEEGSVPLKRFSLEGPARKKMRHVRNKLEKDGCTFEVVEAAAVPALLPELRAISDVWLEDKHSREKSFSLGHFEDGYLRQFPCALVRQHGRIIAFANLWPGAPGGELSIDLMRHSPDVPQGVMDFLFTNLMEWGRDHGFANFDLGMAPLAGLRTGPFATLWNRLASLAYRYGEYFYNFQGLRQYKDKFDPEWRPRYLVCPGGRAVPGVLADLAALISGGLLGAIRK
jgi:phosphatidylglycerol lysyltransferase